MKLKQKILLIITLITLSFLGYSQNRVIEGYVISFKTYPIKNIKVTAKKSKEVITTDENGFFRIEVEKGDVIRIKDPVFLNHQMKVSDDIDNMNINLIFEDSEKNIEKAVQKGYFKEEDLLYALENLYRKNNIYSHFADVYDAIKYAVPQAQSVEITTGEKAFVLRGINSLTGNNFALYLLNNKLIQDVSFIDPMEIKKIRALSNTQAALYGSRAAAGIISIETY